MGRYVLEDNKVVFDENAAKVDCPSEFFHHSVEFVGKDINCDECDLNDENLNSVILRNFDGYIEGVVKNKELFIHKDFQAKLDEAWCNLWDVLGSIEMA